MPIESLNFTARSSLTPAAQIARPLAPAEAEENAVAASGTDAPAPAPAPEQTSDTAPAAQKESPPADLSSLRGAIVDLVV